MNRFYLLLLCGILFAISNVKSFEPELLWKVNAESASTNRFTFSEDGKYIYVQYSYSNIDTSYKFIRKWNIDEKKSEKDILSKINISQMIASKNGKYLLASDKSVQLVYLIDLETGETKTFDKIKANELTPITFFSFSDDDSRINVYHNTVNQIQIYDVKTLKKVDSINARTGAIYIQLSKDGKYAAVNNPDSTLSILDIKTKKEIHNLKFPFSSSYIYNVKMNPDYIILNFSSDKIAEKTEIYSMKTGEIIAKTTSSFKYPYSILLSDNHTILTYTSAIYNPYYNIEKYDIESGISATTNIIISGGEFSVSPKNDKIVVRDSLSYLRIYDFNTTEFYFNLDLPTDNLYICNSILISSDKKYVYTAGRKSSDTTKKGQIIVRDFKSGSPIKNIPLSETKIVQMVMSDDKSLIAAIDSIGTVFVLYDIDSPDMKIKEFKLGKYMDVLTISHDNTKLFAAGEMTGFFYVNLVKDSIKYGFKDPYKIFDIDIRIKSLIVNKNADKLLLAGRKNIVYRFNYIAAKDDYELIDNLVLDPNYFEPFNGIINMGLSEDEKKLYCISNYKYFHLADIEKYSNIYQNKIYPLSDKFDIKSGTYFKGFNKAIIGGSYGDVCIFDVNTGGQLTAITKEEPMYQVWVTSVVLSDDNKFVAYSFNNGESGVYRIDEDSIDVSVNEEINNSNLIISPNPASDYITISLPNSNHTLQGVDENGVQIFNTLGIEVGQSSMIDDRNRIDISNLSAGVYLIRIGDKVEKFVKM